MKKYFFAFLALIIIVACNKDKFQTKPSLELKSINKKTLQPGEGLNITLKYTDKEGDVQDTLFFTKVRTNQRKTATLRDSLKLSIPNFPKTSQGEIKLALDNSNYLQSAQTPPRIPGSNPPIYEPDSLTLKFVLKDKAGNKSDTLTINNIIVIR